MNDIDTTNNLKALTSIGAQIAKMFNGLNRAKKKLKQRASELGGPLGMFDEDDGTT